MEEAGRWTARRIAAQKGRGRLACVTVCDCPTARLAEEAGIPLLLVGDSLAMTVLGYASTLPVTMEEMLHHTRAAVRGAGKALVVADMPFLSYQVSDEQAIAHAGRFLKEAGADAVKLEGGAFRAPLVEKLVANGIPVMGHIGLTPQSLRALGGHRVQGRTPPEAEALLADARALDRAGVFALVLECVPGVLAADLTAAVKTVTIGIGAGPSCDGQVLVLHDLLGLYGDFKPRFVKRYAELGRAAREALEAYRRDVEDGAFPAEEHTF